MPYEAVALGDLGPWDPRFRCIRVLATKAIFVLALSFVKLYHIDQSTVSGRRFKAYRKIWIFLLEPLSNRLVRVAIPKSADDLAVVAIAPNCTQYRPLPGTLFPQSLVVCVQIVGIISYLTIVVFEDDIVMSQAFDFFDEVVLVRFGMGLVDASKLSCSTSTAKIWSSAVTLEKKKQARKSAFASTKTNASSACSWHRYHRMGYHGRFVPFAWPFCMEYRPYWTRCLLCAVYDKIHPHHYHNHHHHHRRLLLLLLLLQVLRRCPHWWQEWLHWRSQYRQIWPARMKRMIPLAGSREPKSDITTWFCAVIEIRQRYACRVGQLCS